MSARLPAVTAALAAALALPAPARAASEFIEALRKAESRAASDPERVEFATRAIRAWRSGDGRLMLAAAHLRRAEGLLKRRDLPEAVEDLTKAVENDPGGRLALRLRGEALLELGKPYEAEKDFILCTGLDAGDADCWVGVARARLPEVGSPRPAPARQAANRARRLAPGDWRPDWLDGRSWLLERRADAALEPLGKAVAGAKGARYEPLAERAAAHTALGRHADAVADWSAALPLLERAREEGERARAPEKVRQLDRSRLAGAYFSRGRLREFLLQNDAALADYHEACALGHKEACAKRPAGGAAAAARRRPAPAQPEEPEPPQLRRPKPKRPKDRAPRGGSGERIYAN